ncbi:MAG: hypothetical protein RBT11_17780 [Desulfobacterales bacterium]|nr:hypothetical protein [Desulfobacterales bacterium]
MPRIYYFLPGRTDPVSETSAGWRSALPLQRHAARAPFPENPEFGWTHGVYFQTARDFLERNRYALLVRAVSSRLKRPVNVAEISLIQITIMKHGAFYHPALVQVAGFSEPLFFVLNAAVSKNGKQILHQEFEALARLGQIKGHAAYLPRVYGQASVPTPSGDTAEMFLGDWFAGFHEFHLSKDNDASAFNLRVWDDVKGHHFLSDKQSLAVYQQAAGILTSYYNPVTFEQIFPWHHAAGDFIVREDGFGMDVRLITVRQYAPLFDEGRKTRKESAPLEQVLFGLLIFLLNLSLRMRIDRIDGTGELVWAKESALAPVWKGFLEGLRMNRFGMPASNDLISKFKAYLFQICVSDAFELARAAAGGFHPEAAERELIALHLIDHVAALWAIITQGGGGQ